MIPGARAVGHASAHDVHVVTQGKVLVVPDWPPVPDIPDWLRLVIVKPAQRSTLDHARFVEHLRRLYFV